MAIDSARRSLSKVEWRGLATGRVISVVVLIGCVTLVAPRIISGGQALRANGEAYTQHRASAEQNRAEINLRFEQAVAMLHIREFDHAITALHRVLELAPEMPEAHANLGFALLGRGDAALAADFFESAIALRSDQSNAYYGLALARAELGDLARARDAMRVFVHLLSPTDPFRSKAASLLDSWRASGTESAEKRPHARSGG